MTRHMIRFRYVCRWDEYAEIEVPDGATQGEIDALIDKAESSVTPEPPLDAVEYDSHDWVGVKPVPAPARWVLGDLTRFEYDDDFWYSDGWAAVREGAPVPTERQDPVSPATGEQYAKWLRERLGCKPEPPHLATFHARYRALLEHADERRWCGQFLALFRGGKVFAVVGPNYDGTLDACGREVSHV